MNFCYNSPWCETDQVCRCDKWEEEQENIPRLKDVKIKVRSIMEEFPETRNSDGVLFAEFIFKHCKNLVRKDGESKSDAVLPLRYFRYLPSLETVRRSRQLIQNDDGEFLPTDPNITKLRRIKQMNYQDAEVREAKAV